MRVCSAMHRSRKIFKKAKDELKDNQLAQKRQSWAKASHDYRLRIMAKKRRAGAQDAV